mmetsp:Transcript_50309/g.57726  ORF Transcript_50309/g.57726 Transcript_50309/m.57726 type:complete len:216 (-) Transcript_50309:491-1138(-)
MMVRVQYLKIAILLACFVAVTFSLKCQEDSECSFCCSSATGKCLTEAECLDENVSTDRVPSDGDGYDEEGQGKKNKSGSTIPWWLGIFVIVFAIVGYMGYRRMKTPRSIGPNRVLRRPTGRRPNRKASHPKDHVEMKRVNPVSNSNGRRKSSLAESDISAVPLDGTRINSTCHQEESAVELAARQELFEMHQITLQITDDRKETAENEIPKKSDQ